MCLGLKPPLYPTPETNPKAMSKLSYIMLQSQRLESVRVILVQMKTLAVDEHGLPRSRLVYRMTYAPVTMNSNYRLFHEQLQYKVLPKYKCDRKFKPQKKISYLIGFSNVLVEDHRQSML